MGVHNSNFAPKFRRFEDFSPEIWIFELSFSNRKTYSMNFQEPKI